MEAVKPSDLNVLAEVLGTDPVIVSRDGDSLAVLTIQMIAAFIEAAISAGVGNGAATRDALAAESAARVLAIEALRGHLHKLALEGKSADYTSHAEVEALRALVLKIAQGSKSADYTAHAEVEALRALLRGIDARLSDVQTGNATDTGTRDSLSQSAAQGPVPQALVREVTVGGEQQVRLYEDAGSTQITPAGANWHAPVIGPFNIVRILGDRDGGLKIFNWLGGDLVKRGAVVIGKYRTGQSLALGSRGFIPDPDGDYTFEAPDGVGRLFLPLTQSGYEGRCLSLKGGPRPEDWEGSTAYEDIREYADGLLGETGAAAWAFAMRDWDIRQTALDARWVYSISALGGVPYASLKKGTSIYADGLAQMVKQYDIATANSWEFILPTIDIDHGESQTDATVLGYADDLDEWVSDYRADFLAETGVEIRMALISQVTTTTSATRDVPLAQLHAHETYPHICLVGPKYAGPYWDQYHELAPGYVAMAGLRARADRFALTGMKWQPLKPVALERIGTELHLTLNNVVGGGDMTPGPIGALVIDTDRVSDPGDYGFRIEHSEDVTIDAIRLSPDGCSLILTLNQVPMVGATLTYAMQTTGVQPTNGHRGCIRDGDCRDRSRLTGDYLFNWLCAFEREI